MRKSDTDGRDDSGAHRLAAMLRQEATASVDAERDRAGWLGLLRGAREEDRRSFAPERRGRAWLAIPVVAAIAAVAFGVRHWSTSSRLSFTIDGGSLDGRFVVEAEHDKRLDFSDGSRLVLHGASRLRVTDINADGAALALDRGELELSIHHRSSTHWRLAMGPYAIAVTGTRFSVRWDPATGDIGVDMLDGSVTVQGPGVGAPVGLRVGQRFRANRSGAYAIEGSSGPPSRVEAIAGAASRGLATAPAGHTRAAPASSASRASSTREALACDWTDLVARGRFDDTLREARALGVDAVLDECPTGSLFALADAARYRGQFTLATRTLETIRVRSPEQAGRAAFFLGRVEEARGDFQSAAHWYSEAASRSRQPDFAEEAKLAGARVSKRMGLPPSRSHVDP